MRIVYVWWGNSEGPFEFEGTKRPPDELYVEQAARELGHVVTRTHYADKNLGDKVLAAQPDLVLFSHPHQAFVPQLIELINGIVPDCVKILLSFDLTNFSGDPTRTDRYEQVLKYMDGRIERVEELFLGALLVRQEMDVVHHEHVNVAVLGAELLEIAVLERADEVVDERLAREVQDLTRRVPIEDRVAQRLQQVGLAETDAAVEEEGVVGLSG